MTLLLQYTPKVRQALKRNEGWGIDLLLLAGIAGLIAAVGMMLRQAARPMEQHVIINLSLLALPKYTLFSLGRGFAAYFLSLVFTLVYGTIAAHNHRAEKVMIPALDILQSIPVLGFMPGLVLGMISLFPSRVLGLELACVLMIFTAQAWNMVFSFHGSLKGIPSALREASAIQRLSGWQIFKLLEVPASMIGLVWNSMMSMAGGWFFLTVNEAFQLKINGVTHDFRLPGIGSYMSEAISESNKPAMIAAIIMMIVMIIAVDQLFWRPIVVWSQRFKLEDTAAADVPQSWVVNLFRKSSALKLIQRALGRRKARMPAGGSALAAAEETSHQNALKPVVTWMAMIILAAIALLGVVKLGSMLAALPLRDHSGAPLTERQDWIAVLLALLASFARTTGAVLLGVAWTLPVGILIGLSTKWSNRLQPIIQVLASFPAPMLFPLAVIVLAWLHIPFTIGCMALMLLGAQWYILFNVIAGATAIPAELKEAAEVYRLTRAQRWMRLYLPSVFPYLVTGLITAAGGAWNATIVAEYLSIGDNTLTAFGLGSIISQASANEQYPLLAASVVTMALFVVLLNRLIWKRLYRLAEARYSFNT